MAAVLKSALPSLTVTPIPPPPEPQVLVSDDFNRPDGDLNGSVAQTGQAWTVSQAAVTVAGNKMTPGTGSGHTAIIEAGQSDVDITVDVNYVPGGAAGVIFRVLAPTTDRWGIFLQSGLEMRLYRLVGSASSIATSANSTTVPSMSTLTGSHVLRVRVKGQVIKVWVDGIECLTHTMSPEDAAASAAWTKVGTLTSAASAMWDNFVVKEAL